MSCGDAVPRLPFVPPEQMTCIQRVVLRRAVAKLVLIGERVGVTSEQMIFLLESGFTVRELLDYVAARERDQA